jgi:hypothetical protein
MAWTQSSVEEMQAAGTYRLTLSYPAEFLVPDIGTPKEVSLFSRTFTLSEYYIDPVLKKLVVVIRVAEEETPLDQGGLRDLPIGVNPYQPGVWTSGGTVKAPLTAYREEKPQILPAIAPALILGVIAALLGIALIWLTLDKVEKLSDSPTFNVIVLTVAAVAFFIMYRQLKAA